MKKITKLLMGMLFATAMTIVGCKSGDSGTFTVTFNANGGTGAPDAVTVESGTTITKPTTDPTYDGYTFNGWYTEAAATTAFDFSTRYQ